MNNKNGTIFLQANRDWGHWYSNLVTWLITKMPVRGPFIHTQIYLNGYVYEYTINGDGKARKRLRSEGAGTDNREAGDLVLEPKFDLTDEQVKKMIDWWEFQIDNGYKYGVAKLLIQLSLGLILRPFAQFIYCHFGWELMKNNKFWGEHCSAAVDECFKEAGIDLFPRESEQYTTPSAFAYLDNFGIV